VKIGTRLYIALIPAVLGLLTVAALGYWGQYAYRVPAAVVAIAAVGALGSFFVAWRNTKYVARRIERLASVQETPRGRDEIFSIERTVDQLRADVVSARDEGERRESRAIAARAEMSDILAHVADAAVRAIDDVRLPLHILLDNRFGDLNENQEEMLGAAQSAVDAASALLHRTRTVAALDQGTLQLRRDPWRVDDVLSPVLTALKAEAETRQVQLHVDIAPALPRIVADRTHLQDALSALLRSGLRRTDEGGRMTIEAKAERDHVRVEVTHGPSQTTDVEYAIARRLFLALGGSIEEATGRTVLSLPTASLRAPH
jgi:signal transduction histidine kinase